MLDAVSWNSTSSGSWDVAGNWSSGKVPTASDDVTINQPGVTVTISAADVAQSLTSSDAIVVSSGSLTLGGDSSTSGTLTIDSGATLTTDGVLTLSGDTADNSGTLAVVGGLSFAGATLTNEASGTVDLQADVGIAAASGTNTIHNAGLLEKSAGSGTSTVAVDLDSMGTVHVKSGTLSLSGAITQVSGGTLTAGTWDVDNKAALNFGSTANLSTNQATVNLAGPNASFTQFASVMIVGGTVSLTGGEGFSASGPMTVSGTLSLDTGTLSLNNNSLVIQSGGSLTFGGTAGVSGASQITDSGTLDYNGTGTANVGNTFDLNGGTVKVDSGNLTLSGGFGTETGGTYNVASGSVLDLTGGSNGDTFTGTYTGSGGGQVQLNSGSIQIGNGGVTFDFPRGMFQWTGGNIGATFSGGASITNTGLMTIDTAGGVGLNAVPIINQGEIDDAGAGNLNSNTSIDNQAKATFVIQSTGGVTGGTFSSEGTLKMTGTGTANLQNLELNDGTVEADSGNLVFSGASSSTGGNFVVSQGATVDLTGGNTTTLTGTFTGSGAGQVQLNSGSIAIGGANATFDFPKGMFQWTGGTISNAFNTSPTLTNAGFITIDTTSGVSLNSMPLVNQDEIDDSGAGSLNVNGSLDNQAKATFDIQNTGGVGGNGSFSNEGTLKMTSSGAAIESPTFNLNGGTVEVDSGKLTLAGGFGTETGGTYNVAAGSVLDLTGGSIGDVFNGTFTGTGAGQVQLNSGSIAIGGGNATFNFPKGMFQWAGGSISNAFNTSPTLTNASFITIDTTSSVALNGTSLINQGEIDETNTGGLALSGSLDNQAKASFIIQSTGAFGGGGTFGNEGTLKITGSGTATVGAPFDLNGGTVEVDSGMLVLGSGGEGTGAGTNTGGSYVVDQGATLDLNGGQEPTYTGTYTGTGGGRVQFNGGALVIGSGGATFDFAEGMFQWTSGSISNGFNILPTFANTGFMAINALATMTIGVPFVNQGEIDVIGGGGMGINQPFDNQATGSIVFSNSGSFGIGTGSGSVLSNEGTIKMTGSGTTSLTLPINVNDGTVEADSGDLVFHGSAGQGAAIGGNIVVKQGATIDLSDTNQTYTGTTFSVAGGATLDLGGATINGSLTGAGTVNFSSLVVATGGVVADLGNFNWTGGGISTKSGDLTNLGTMTISGSDEHELYNDGTLDNRGTIVQTGVGNLGMHSDSQFPTTLNNEAGAVYNIEADSGIDNPIGGTTALVNDGLIEKTAGTATSTLFINGSITNTGTMEADSGTLALSGTLAQLPKTTLTAGTWNAVNGATLALPSGDSVTANQGTITLSGAGASITGLAPLAANSGALTLTDGATFATAGDFADNGALTVGPGSTLTVNGAFTEAPSAALAVTLGGTPASGQFGQVTATGAATLGGTLQLALAGSYSPSNGDSFQVLKFANSSASFAAITSPQYHGGNLFQEQTNATNVTVTAATAVADLSVTSATLVTTTAQAGQPVTVNYQVTDLGQGTVATTWQDAVFASTDATLDSSAVLLGHVTHTGAVAANGSYSGTFTAPLPLLLPGSYHVFVEADSQGIVPDSDRANNTLQATGTFSVTVPTLPLLSTGKSQFVQFTMSKGEERLYEINIPAGADVIIASDGNNQGAQSTQVLAALGAVPTTSSTFPSYVGNEWFDPSTVTIDGAQGGTYYVAVSDPNGTSAGDTIFMAAEQLPLVVNSFSPTQALNVGPVTVTINGDGFTPSTQVSLTTGPFGTTIPAGSVTFVNSTTLQATFDLLNAAVPFSGDGANGEYTVQVSDHGQTFDSGSDPTEVIDQMFSIQRPGRFFDVLSGSGTAYSGYYSSADPATWGVNASIYSSVSAPSAVRTGRVNTLGVNYYSNAYAGDRVEAPLLLLSSDNAEFQLPGQSGFTSGSIMLLGVDNNGDGGPAGSLPGTEPAPLPATIGPGIIGPISIASQAVVPHDAAQIFAGGPSDNSLNVNFIATSAGPVNFQLHVADPEAAIDWSSLSSSLEPPGMPAAAWNVIFANFTAEVGAFPGQNGDIFGTLGSLQTVLDQDATYLAQIGEPTADVNTLLDFQLQQAGDYGAIAQRYTQGIFGLGHSDPTMTAVADAQGNVEIISGSTARQFTLQRDGTYQGAPGDDATLKLIDGAYQLRETSGYLEVFNANGSLDFLQDTNGNKIVYGYTGTQLTSLTDSATGDVTTLTYNGQNLVSQITDPEGRITSLQYDSAGRLTSITTPLGATTYTYVTSGTPQQLNAVASITGPNGTQYSFTYDPQGRLIGQTLNGGTEPLSFAYSIGAITTTDALKNTTTEFLSDSGQVVEIVDPLGNIVQGNFNAAQQPVSITAPGAFTSSIAYGVLGRPISFVDPLGQQTSATYNPTFAGLQTLTDPAGHSLQYSYDPANGNLSSVAYPDGSSQQYAYNALGEPTQYINRSGQAVAYEYYPSGLLKSITLSDGTQQTFTYDGHRNLASMTDSTGTTTFSYTSADELEKVSYPNGTFLAYTYNALGQRIQMQDQTGFTVNYSYNALGQLSKLTDGGGKLIVSYQYDLAGRIDSEDFGNGTSTQFKYDANDNILSILNLAPDGATQSSYVYTYNDQNLPVTMTNAAGKFTYGYDADGQLVSVQTPGGQTISYQYDAAGNRVAVVSGGQTISYTSNNLNEYTQVGNATYKYNADGELVSSSDASGTTSYVYNVLGQLTSVVSPSGSTTYQYNALGQVVSEDVNGTVTNLLNDPTAYGTVVGQFDASGSPLAQYAYGLGLVSQTTAAGSNNFYSFDAAGSTTQLTGATGSLLDSYSYLPFGEQLSASGTTANPFTYIGQLGVMAGAGAGGLFHMGYRWYDPSLGRFDEPDPTGIAGGDTNFYRYVDNSPVINRDPSGLDPAWARSVENAITNVMIGPPPGAASNNSSNNVVSLTPQQTSAVVGVGSGVAGTGAVAGTVWVASSTGGATAATGVVGASFTPTVMSGVVAGSPGTLAMTTGRIIGTTGGAGETALGTSAAEVTGGAALGLSAIAVVGGVGIGIGVNHIPGVPERVQNAINYWFPNLGQSNQDPLSDAAKKRLADGFKPSSGANSQSETPHDPNLLTGPAGVGSQGFVSGTATLPYRVDFENQPTATAAADTVTVTQQLDPSLDLSTFQLGNIGFGNSVVQVPAGLTSYSTRVTLPATAPGAGPKGLLVDVSASLNVQTGLVTWTLTSLDPVTMDSPLSPAEGLLPPDNANGDGEGFVSYTIQPKGSATTGTAVNAQATIVFDTNAPISTAPISNTIDAAAPTSRVAALPTDSPPKFTVSWSGQDDAGGSGIASYNVYVSDNSGPYAPLVTNTTETSTLFTGQLGHTYVFFSVATDNAGNVEANPIHGQAITTIESGLPTSTVNPLPSQSPLSFKVSWSSSGLGGPGTPTFNVFVSDNGGPFTAFQTATTATSATFTGKPGHSYGFYSVVTDSAGNVQAVPTAAQASTSLPSDLNTLYASAVYEDVLGRPADPDGLAYWTHLLDTGTAVSSVAEAIAHSAEYYANFVIKPVYLDLLGRAADAAGLAYWTQKMQAGLTDQGLEAGFISSDEFYAKAGGTNTAWIDAVYKLLLGRPADASGEGYWNAQLASGVTRLAVAEAIAGSTENDKQLITADYQHYLGRAPDQGGLTYWLQQFAAGMTNEDVIAGFTGSAEYYKEHTS